MEWVNLIVSILSGISVCVPLIIALIQNVRENVNARNWSAIIKFVVNLMESAELMFETGAQKKDFVMSEISTIQKELGTDFEEEKIAKLIDAICLASKTINSKEVK